MMTSERGIMSDIQLLDRPSRRRRSRLPTAVVARKLFEILKTISLAILLLNFSQRTIDAAQQQQLLTNTQLQQQAQQQQQLLLKQQNSIGLAGPSSISAPPKSLSNREIEKQIVDRILGEGYDKRIRPAGPVQKNSTQSGTTNNTNNNDGPTIVKVNTLVRSISKIDDVTMEYSVQLTLRQEWTDDRLAFRKMDQYKNYTNINSITLTEQERIWKPDLFFRNEKEGHFHKIIMPNVLLRIQGDGQVLYSIRISLVLACPMDLKYYPLDKQNCTIEMASYGYLDEDLKFFWKETNPVQIAKPLNLPRFTLETYDTAYCTSRTTTGAYSCLRIDLIFKREFSYYLIQIYIPCCMLVIVSWVSFWLDPNAIPARVSLGVTTLLTMATQISGINASLPPVSYTKAIDVWTGVCLTFVFGALLEFALVNYASRSDQHKREMLTSALTQTQQMRWREATAAAAAAGVAPPTSPPPDENSPSALMGKQAAFFAGPLAPFVQQQQHHHHNNYHHLHHHQQQPPSAAATSTACVHQPSMVGRPLVGSGAVEGAAAAAYNNQFIQPITDQQQQSLATTTMTTTAPSQYNMNHSQFKATTLGRMNSSGNQQQQTGDGSAKMEPRNGIATLGGRIGRQANGINQPKNLFNQQQQQQHAGLFPPPGHGVGNGNNSTALAAAGKFAPQIDCALQYLRSPREVHLSTTTPHKRRNWCKMWLAKFPTRSKRIDVISRIFFPLKFALFNLVYWTTYLFREEDTTY